MLRHTSGRWLTGLLVPLAALVLPFHPGGDTTTGLVYVSTNDGISVLDSSSGEETRLANNAMPSGDWSLVVGAHRTTKGTSVLAIDPSSYSPLRQQQFDGNLQVRAVSHSGDIVALMPKRYRNDGVYAPGNRRSTKIVVTRLHGELPNTYNLDANVEPEAFSADGTALFVIQYKPAMNPDRYRVRRLDLGTGQLSDVYTNDKLIQGDMRGVAYDQAAAPDGSKLYTLYRKHTGETFVHLLDLVNQTAQCVLLPNNFGQDAAAMAITTRPDGAVFVVDPVVREIAELDPQRHGVASNRSYKGIKSDRPVVAAATDQAIFVASGNKVVELSEPGLEVQATRTVDSRVESLLVGSNQVLYIALRDRLIGMRLDSLYAIREQLLDVKIDGIRGIGDALPQTAKGTVECAC
jgi:hypothetical protein